MFGEQGSSFFVLLPRRVDILLNRSLTIVQRVTNRPPSELPKNRREATENDERPES